MVADIFTKSIPKECALETYQYYVVGVITTYHWFDWSSVSTDQPIGVTSTPEEELGCVWFEGSPYEDEDIGDTQHIGYYETSANIPICYSYVVTQSEFYPRMSLKLQ